MPFMIDRALFLFTLSPTPFPRRVSQKGHGTPCPYSETGNRGISYPYGFLLPAASGNGAP